MLRIAQSLSLQQKMAPQLIQSLQLLQMSTLQLELEIKQQLELNPLIEESMELIIASALNTIPIGKSNASRKKTA